jgi:hypothetical protein
MTTSEDEKQRMSEHPSDPDALTSVHKLAHDLDLDTVLAKAGESEAAEKLFRHSLAIREKTPGLGDFYTLKTM